MMQTAALSTITAAAAMTIISVSLGLCGYSSWRVASKGISRSAWKHLLPTTAACWWNVSNTNTLLLGSTLALTACIVVATAVCTDLTFSSAATATNQAAGAWEHHWQGVYAQSRLRARLSAAHAWIETETPEGRVKENYLIDLGAAASAMPLSAFTRVCFSLKLNPSQAKLAGCTGHRLAVEGEGPLSVIMPGTKQPFQHNIQVVSDGAMPSHLRILGIDFWHRLKSNVDMASMRVTGITPSGEHFSLPFSVSKSKQDSILGAVTAFQVEAAGSEEDVQQTDGVAMVLPHHIRLHPGQVLELQMAIPDTIQDQLKTQWEHSWLTWWLPRSLYEHSSKLLWEPSSYRIAIGNSTLDIIHDEGQYTDVTPTSVSILKPSWGAGTATVKPYLYLPEDAKEDVILPGGSVIGKISVTKLLTMEDPLIAEMMERLRPEVEALLQQQRDKTERVEELSMQINSLAVEHAPDLLQYINSIRGQELRAEHKVEGTEKPKQTTVRHSPVGELPSHDVRGRLSGIQVVETWEKLMEAEPVLKKQYETWTNTGPGKGIEYGDKLTPAELRQLKVLTFAFKDIFSINPKAPPEVKGIEHALYFKTGNPRPHRRPIPQMSIDKLKHMDNEIATMLANHIIQHSDSEWSTLPVFARKKDGTFRTAIDYRGVNEQILGDNFSIPNIAEVLNSLAAAKRFSCYDCSAGFWGLKLREQDRQYTAFHGYHNGAWGLFEFCRMPFGLKAATATYQRMQQRIMGPKTLPQNCSCRSDCRECKGKSLSCKSCRQGCDDCVGLVGRIVRVFVDDGCVYSEEEKDHINDLARVFCRLAANRVELKPVKCIFGTDHIALLGHEVLAKKGIRPDPDKIKAILQLDLPQTVDALHNFIGATGWVSKFIPEYAELAKPLRDIIHSYDKKSKANIEHEWEHETKGAAAKRAFEVLRLSLASRPCLAFPDFNSPFIIVTDASKVAVAAVLCQMAEDGTLRPVAYASTPLTKAEKNLGITALEGYALCFALKKWRHLLTSTTICITDHSALKSLINPNKDFDSARMARMALTLSEYDLVIVHRPGESKELIISDMLSRCTNHDDQAKLDSLMEQAWGCIGQLCTETTLELSKQALASKAQQRRLQHVVDAATLTEVINSKEVTTVRGMVHMIKTGQREHKPPAMQDDQLAERFTDMYDMITAMECEQAEKSQQTNDSHVLAAQLVDPFCKQIKSQLQGKSTRIADDQLYYRCKWQAPFHIVTPDGLLRRLLWKKGTKADAQLMEGRAPAVVPDAAAELQRRLCKQIHSETGHSAFFKSYGQLLDRYIWAGMTAHLMGVVTTCNQCSYFGDKPARAPLTGHVVATEPAQRVQLDVVHMKEVEGYSYVLTITDVFSRWGMAIALKNLKSATIVTALRRTAIPAGLGRPGEFLIDGGSEFKLHLEEACAAWGSKWRPHTPHHSSSAGLVERFNKTIELRLAHFSKECNCSWLDAIPLAVEAYNGSVHAALSKGGNAFSPAEIWLGRKLRFNSDVRPALHDRPTEVQQYGEWLRLQTEAVKLWIIDADAKYRATLETTHSRRTIRELKVGDKVLLHKPPERREKNSGQEPWDGPWEVEETGELPTDFKVKRIGARRGAIWQHIDNLKLKVEDEQSQPAEVAEQDVMRPAAESSRVYQVEAILGEKGRSRATKHYLVKYKDYADAWWQPGKNLTKAQQLVQEWDSLSAQAKQARTDAATVANPEDINLLMDLRRAAQPAAAQLIKDICKKLGIKRSQLRAILASPPCNSYTRLDAVNIERGNNFREPKKPYPPRKCDGSLKSIIKRQIAQEHDDMVSNLLDSILADKADGYSYDFCIENPRGMLRHRPYMNTNEWLTASDLVTTDYCVHDHPFQKPTDLWHSFGEKWQPKGLTGDGKCHQKCGKGCYKANGKFSHFKRLGGPAGTGVTGPDQLMQKWKIPHKLCEEVLAEMPARVGQDIVLDLFSGGESYRAAVEAAGYRYVPVDILTLGERPASKAAGEAAQVATLFMQQKGVSLQGL